MPHNHHNASNPFNITVNNNEYEVQESTLNFSSATAYRKQSILNKSATRLSGGGEKIDTIIDGKLERSGTTAKGDIVVTGGKGEEYIIKAEKFPTLYEEHPANPAQYRSRNHGVAIKTAVAVTVVRADGTKVSAKAGDYLYRSTVTNTVNVIDSQELERTYAPETRVQDPLRQKL